MDQRHEIPALGDEWDETHNTIAQSGSADGKSNKRLRLKIRFDGNGNAVVRFEVQDHGKSIEYEKFDAAVYNYNRAP